MSTDQLPHTEPPEQGRLEAALRESEMLRELTALLASSLDLEHILQVLVKRATQVCEVERCSVWLIDETRKLLSPKTYYMTAKALDRNVIDAADRMWYRSPLSMEDAAIHLLFSDQGILYIQDLRTVPSMQAVAEVFLVRSVLLVALIREGRPVGMLSLDNPGVTRDFTPEQKQLACAIGQQAAIAIDNARLAEVANERANTMDAIFQAMTEGIVVTDMEGNTLVLNNAASHFLGLPKNYMAPLNDFLLNYPPYTLEGRENIPAHNFPLSRALRGERIRAERFIAKRADGEERILEINIAPFKNAEGNQIGVVSAFRDVTETSRAELRIRQALNTLLHVAEAVSGITDIQALLHSVLERTLVTLNCQRGAVYLLDERQRKFHPFLTIGFAKEKEQQWLEEQSTWLDPSHEQDDGFYQQLMAGHPALINAEQSPYQSKLAGHINVLAAPIKHNNRAHGLLILDRSLIKNESRLHASQDASGEDRRERQEFSIWDITVLDGIAQLAGLAVEQARWQQEAINARAREDAMRQANEAKDEFMAITAHEFRTPLTVILAQSQLVTRNLTKLQIPNHDLMGKAIKNLSVVEEQARQLTDIVKTFLEVTHLNRGQLALDMTTLNLDDIARQVVDQYSATSELHTIRCVIDASQRPMKVRGDSARMQQIIGNLVENAIKYSPLGGPVTVRLRHITGGDNRPLIEVCVEDKGIGIPTEFQSRLFERFYRAPSSTETKTKGIGLGLYIVSQLIQLQGGTIHVESSGVLGEGSHFIFSLPALNGSDVE